MIQNGLLKTRFAVYWHEMERCRKAAAYWAPLHVAVCLPDICAALQSSNGRATGDRYKKWCNRFASDPLLTGGERWDMRCKVLHQGRAKVGKRGRYSEYTFSQPAATGERDHKRIERSTLHLDVGELARETSEAVEKWIEWIEANPRSPQARAVEKNLPSLVTVVRVPVVQASGIIFQSFKTN
jgi:hypothetical protein